MMNKPELLAPAGSFESVEAAFVHGADAVYTGIGPFNLRALSPSFMLEDLPRLMALGREYKKKIYCVLNIMPDDTALDGIEEFLAELAHVNDLPDALIVSDPGVLSAAQEALGNRVEYHLSTQTGTFNRRDMAFWKERGVSRVVLPREMSIEQIDFLSKSGICETEIFIHGAMCMAISGRCLMGAYLSGRHPNQGVCPQPCRYKYQIAPVATQDHSDPQWFDIEEDEHGTYIMNSRDLNTISILPQIIEAGVHSLKIEGRNKSIHYVSAVVRAYRTAIDRYCANPEAYTCKDLESELDRVEHRSYTTGFYGNESILQDFKSSRAESRVRVVGVVKGVFVDGRALVDVKNPFTSGELLELLPVGFNRDIVPLTIVSISDVNNNLVESAITNRVVYVSAETSFKVGDVIRRVG